MLDDRWVQLALGLICMMAISSPQYVWTLFTKPLGGDARRQPRRSCRSRSRMLIVLQTLLLAVPGLAGRPLRAARCCRRRRGADRPELGAGRACRDVAAMLYLTYGLLGGIGTGIVYVGVVGQMVQLVPRPPRLRHRHGRRGLRHGRDADDVSDRHQHRDASATSTTLLHFGFIFGAVGAARRAGSAPPPPAAMPPRRRPAAARGRASAPSRDAEDADLLADVRDDDA